MPAVSRSVRAREVLDHTVIPLGIVIGLLNHILILARWFAQGPDAQVAGPIIPPMRP